MSVETMAATSQTHSKNSVYNVLCGIFFFDIISLHVRCVGLRQNCYRVSNKICAVMMMSSRYFMFNRSIRSQTEIREEKRFLLSGRELSGNYSAFFK